MKQILLSTVIVLTFFLTGCKNDETILVMLRWTFYRFNDHPNEALMTQMEKYGEATIFLHHQKHNLENQRKIVESKQYIGSVITPTSINLF
jgi:hypothetical protein